MALILDDDSLLDAADGFAGWDDALVDDTLAQELEQERAAELESELEQDERPIDYDAESLITSTLRFSCFLICSKVLSSLVRPMVMRDTPTSSVTPTVRLSRL